MGVREHIHYGGEGRSHLSILVPRNEAEILITEALQYFVSGMDALERRTTCVCADLLTSI